jgi:hypothetical protein
MTKANGSYTAVVNSLATEKAAYGPWSTFFASVMTKTGDTGQLAPATTTTYAAGYEIFAFNDALATAFPIYLKVAYTIATNAYLTVQVGTGSNGAGALTGVLATLATGVSVSGSAPTRYWYGSSDGTYLSLVHNLQPAGTSAAATPDSLGAIIIERTRDADGTPNGNGVTLWQWATNGDQGASNNTNNQFQGLYGRYADTTQTQPAASFDYGVMPPNLLNNNAYAGVNANYIFPAYTQIGAQLYGASKALAFAFAGDVPKQQAFSAVHYGTAAQWVALGNGVAAAVPYLSAATTAAIKSLTPVIRWE